MGIMFKKTLFFHLFVLSTSLFATLQEEVEKRWDAFQTDRLFNRFEPGKSEGVLAQEFKNIQKTRFFVWLDRQYEFAYPLIANDLVRARNCVAFAYNNTVPYYNASTVFLNERRYIACEGPRSKDVLKFFELLKTCHVTHLVRLTDAYEGDKKKCYPYWNEKSNYSVRAFDMAYWLDNQGVDPHRLLALAKQVRQEVKESNGLLLVHCSGGVGRTGTFLSALAILDAIDKGEPFSIEEIVYRLSLQRIHSVATAKQYITLHRLAEIYLVSL